MEVVEKEGAKSLYGDSIDDPEFALESMGVAYKLNDDAIWFVKLPFENSQPNPSEAVMVRVEGIDILPTLKGEAFSP